MSSQERIAYRILASLYPDRKPSEIRKIIDKALEKDENDDDIELWAIMTKEKAEKKNEPEKKIIEEHHYHHYDYKPYWYTTVTASDLNPCVTTINGHSDGADSITIDSTFASIVGDCHV